MQSLERRHNLFLFFLMLAATAVYLHAIHAPAFLDDIAEYQRVRGFAGCFGWLQPDCFGLFRPVKNLLFLLFLPAYPAAPWVWHVACLSVHLVNIILIRLWLRDVLRDDRWALVATAMWTLSPTQVSSVAWLSCINIQVMLLAMLTSLRLYERTQETATGRLWRLSAAAAATFLALVSYEAAIVLPALAFLRDWFLNRERLCARTAWLYYGVVAGVCGIYGLMRIGLGFPQPLDNPQFTPISRMTLAMTSPYFTVSHLSLWLWPFGRQSILATFTFHETEVLSRLILSWLVIAALAFLIFLSRRRMPHLSFGLCWFLAAFLPTSNLIPLFVGPFADYYLTLPSVGLVVALAAVLRGWGALPATPRRISTVAGIALAVVVVWRSLAAAVMPGWADTWNSAHALLVQSLRVHPESFAAQGTLADILLARGDLAEAEALAARSAAKAPWISKGYQLLASIHVRQGRYDDALLTCRVAHRRSPQDPTPLVLMAQVQEKHLNKTAEALDNYERALTLEWVSPYSRIAAISLAAAQTRAGNPRKAATILEHAIRRSPDEAELHQSMAATLFLAGDFKQALAHARIAERLGFPMSEAAQATIRRAAKGDEKANIP